MLEAKSCQRYQKPPVRPNQAWHSRTMPKSSERCRCRKNMSPSILWIGRLSWFAESWLIRSTNSDSARKQGNIQTSIRRSWWRHMRSRSRYQDMSIPSHQFPTLSSCTSILQWMTCQQFHYLHLPRKKAMKPPSR